MILHTVSRNYDQDKSPDRVTKTSKTVTSSAFQEQHRASICSPRALRAVSEFWCGKADFFLHVLHKKIYSSFPDYINENNKSFINTF